MTGKAKMCVLMPTEEVMALAVGEESGDAPGISIAAKEASYGPRKFADGKR